MSEHPDQAGDEPEHAAFSTALQRLAVSENGFLFDPSSGNSFMTNKTGLHLLRLLQAGNDVSAIITELSREYDVTPMKLEQDLLEFTAALRKCLGLQAERR